MSDAIEILKPGGPLDKAADLIHRLTGPVFDEFGAMLADKVRPYRVKNLVSTMQMTERILRDAGLAANAVPPRLLLPIIENSSLEDNDTLQEMWAGLLATASQQTDSVSPSFVETLKQLTPDEARYFEQVASTHRTDRLGLRHITPFAFTERGGAPPGVSSDTFERLGLIRRDWGMVAESADGGTDVGYLLTFTKYAKRFLDACHGPRPSPQT
jgi:hypothetical protein